MNGATQAAALTGQIETLRAAFGKVERLDPTGPTCTRLCAILDKADNDALVTAWRANIPFVSVLALNRLIKRGALPEDRK